MAAGQLGVLQVDPSTVAGVARGLRLEVSISWPIRGQYSGHVTCIDQSEASNHLGVEVKVEGGGAGYQAVLACGHTEHVHQAAAKSEVRNN